MMEIDESDYILKLEKIEQPVEVKPEQPEFVFNVNSKNYIVQRSKRGRTQVNYNGHTYSIHSVKTKSQARLVCYCTKTIIGMRRNCPAYIIIGTSPSGEETVLEKLVHMCNAATMPENQNFTLTTTHKNKPSIIHEGCTYSMIDKTENSSIYRCTRQKVGQKLRCKARAIINSISGTEQLYRENIHECQREGDLERYEDIINNVALNIQGPYDELDQKPDGGTIHYEVVQTSSGIITLDEATAEGKQMDSDAFNCFLNHFVLIVGFYEEAIFVYGANGSFQLLKDGYRFTKSSQNRAKKITVYRCSYKLNNCYACKCLAYTKMFGNRMMMKLGDGIKGFHSHSIPEANTVNCTLILKQ